MSQTSGIPLALHDPADEVEPFFWELVAELGHPGHIDHRITAEPETTALHLVAS